MKVSREGGRERERERVVWGDRRQRRALEETKEEKISEVQEEDEDL